MRMKAIYIKYFLECYQIIQSMLPDQGIPSSSWQWFELKIRTEILYLYDIDADHAQKDQKIGGMRQNTKRFWASNKNSEEK